MLYYTVFRTNWGHFGLAGIDGTLCRATLPHPRREAAQYNLLKALEPSSRRIVRDRRLFAELQQRIIAYFEGENVDFSTDPPVELDHTTAFARKVLRACRKVPFGRTTTYGELARKIGRPTAARAVGGVMAANPIGLIIPCHRVLRSDGGLGGFSAPGGATTKQRLLQHEQAVRMKAAM